MCFSFLSLFPPPSLILPLSLCQGVGNRSPENQCNREVFFTQTFCNRSPLPPFPNTHAYIFHNWRGYAIRAADLLPANIDWSGSENTADSCLRISDAPRKHLQKSSSCSSITEHQAAAQTERNNLICRICFALILWACCCYPMMLSWSCCSRGAPLSPPPGEAGRAGPLTVCSATLY